MEESNSHPDTVEVFISYFFKWGVPPKEKTVVISWDEFDKLTLGKTSAFPIKGPEAVEAVHNPRIRFGGTVYPDNVDAAIARRHVGITSEILPKFINVVRLK